MYYYRPFKHGMSKAKNMKIHQKKIGEVLIIQPEGRLDASNTQAFNDHVKEKIVEGEKDILFDLSKCEYMSSGGLRSLTLLQSVIKSYQGEIVVCSPNERIQELFALVQLNQIYRIFRNKTGALKGMLKDPSILESMMKNPDVT